MELLLIEPVNSRGHRDQVKGQVGKWCSFSGAEAVTYLWVQDAMLNLFYADVSCLHLGKVLRAGDRRLPIAGGAIPGRIMVETKIAEIGKQCFGILRSVFGVLIGTLGKGLNVVQI